MMRLILSQNQLYIRLVNKIHNEKLIKFIVYQKFKYLGNTLEENDKDKCNSPNVLYAKIYKSSESLFDQEVEEVKTMISKSIVNKTEIDLNVKNLLDEK